MKKLFTIIAMCAVVVSASAQKNLFDKADVDKDGWLWFDTQEKIDKYVGIINEDEYAIDPEGSIIQLVYADQFPDYPVPEADASAYGAGSDGNLFDVLAQMGLDAKKGSIMLNPSTAKMTYNGGGIAIMMPSCKEFSIMCSSEATKYLRVLAAPDANAPFDKVNIGANYVENQWCNIKTYSVFGAKGAGMTTYTGVETWNNGYDDYYNGAAFTIKSESPRCVYLTHGNTYPIYIHGIRVITNEKDDEPQVTPGDVNGDNQISVADLSMMASYILGETPAGFNTAAADLNGDKDVTVADLAQLASAILGN